MQVVWQGRRDSPYSELASVQRNHLRAGMKKRPAI